MASVTLAESAKLSQDLLLSGVIESIVDVNPIYEVFPFMGIEGNSLAYNRENVLGDVQFAGNDDTITAKSPATFTRVSADLTTIIGDAEINGLIQATRSNITDQKAVQIASKAKSIGRQFQTTMVTGDGSGNTFEGLMSLVASTQSFEVGTDNGANLSFDQLDQLIDYVKDKDGQVDYMMMPARTIRSFYALLRQLGGATINDVLELPSGRRVPVYRDIPIFRNDFIPTDQTVGTSDNCTTVFAGTFDDGSGMHGVSGITPTMNAGMSVTEIGESETKDNTITRVKMYTGMALFSELGLAAMTGVTN
ncbi:MAG: phage major capsid protein [Actinobacteria bacterium]|nr:phage major capsid protein [Actinomycetota bacterium]MCA1807279.1 phage major capsid protein [Actinomycetota bacterium]